MNKLLFLKAFFIACLLTLLIVEPVLSGVFSVYDLCCQEREHRNSWFYWIGGTYNQKNGKITIYHMNGSEVTKPVSEYNTLQKIFLAHELCHKEQHEEGRMSKVHCSFDSFLNELECNYKEKIEFWRRI